MATESKTGRPRYAPPDPSLPKPWRALIDGNTGYIYYWNPVTKVTQYQRPENQDPHGGKEDDNDSKDFETNRDAKDHGKGSLSVKDGNDDDKNGAKKEDDSEAHCDAKGLGSSLIKDDAYEDKKDDAAKPHSADGSCFQPRGENTIYGDRKEYLEGDADVVLNASMEEDKGTHKDDEDESKPDKEGEGTYKEGSEENKFNKEDEKHNDGFNVTSSSLQSPKEGTGKANNDDDQNNTMRCSEDASQVVETSNSNASGFNAQPSNKRTSNDDTKADSCKRTRYAPPDPSLPKPWRALIDGNTGFVYFWNPVTKVTQYERPAADVSVLPSSVAPTSFSKGRDTSDTNHLEGSRGPVYNSTMNGQQPSTFGQNVPNSNLQSQVAPSVEAYRRQHEITIKGVNVPAPLMSFNSTGFPNEILREISNAGFSAPTPIQAQSWPIAMKGCDIVAIAKTGSGKTLGYLLPGFILLKRLQNDPKIGPSMLVLSPTRELATQIQDEAVKFGQTSRISCTCLYGGVPKGSQLRELASGADIVVATPGRLNDILEMKRVSLSQVTYLVLDEADRMLDMGFEPQIRKIVAQVPARRQTLMYTATWPKTVRRIAADLLNNPVQVNIGNTDELMANKSITQYVEVITPPEKGRRLEQILKSQEPGSKIIVFCSTKKMCDNLARRLTYQFGAAAIHGDKSQNERDMALNDFRNGKSPVLVATDVAARGLDVKDIRVVVNYDFPTGVEDYVHRIGRTGRAGAKGIAYTFFCDQDSKYASDLVKILEGASQQVPPQLKQMVSYGGYSSRSNRW